MSSIWNTSSHWHHLQDPNKMVHCALAGTINAFTVRRKMLFVSGCYRLLRWRAMNETLRGTLDLIDARADQSVNDVVGSSDWVRRAVEYMSRKDGPHVRLWLISVVPDFTCLSHVDVLSDRCPTCRGRGEVRRTGIYASRFDLEVCGHCEGRRRLPDLRPWLTSTAIDLARSCYENRDERGQLQHDRLNILADSLEESGLSRDAVERFRVPPIQSVCCGFWPLDLVLGKE